ncbi:hypothetical protein [Thermicanus aegyptius]|uniref:hypothetical protein n=1 Tax=Thermicanus aegyptius TaxID=94009 RepID=UPI00048BBE91|nr:hypothetical protein [Thermicanus aegyptius]
MGKIARGSWQRKMFEKMSSPRGLYSSEILKELSTTKSGKVIPMRVYEKKIHSLSNMIIRAIKEGWVYNPVYPVYLIKDDMKNYELLHYIRPQNAKDIPYIRMVSIYVKKSLWEEAFKMIALIEKEDLEGADELAKKIESKMILDAI